MSAQDRLTRENLTEELDMPVRVDGKHWHYMPDNWTFRVGFDAHGLPFAELWIDGTVGSTQSVRTVQDVANLKSGLALAWEFA